MNRFAPPRMVLPVCLALAAVLLAACGGATETSQGPASTGSYPGSAEFSAPAAAATPAPASTGYEEAGRATSADNLGAPAAEPPAAAEGVAGSVDQSLQPTPLPNNIPVAPDQNRKIIKNADMTVEVDNASVSVERVTAAAAQAGGYVLEVTTNYTQADRPSATVKIAVPVERFEETLNRIRGGADKVLSEQASGVDATQEYVDVQSQIANLEATQARIREFLNKATTVEESLQVNAQLAEIEGQISVLKGRLQFLSQRAAYSTITVVILQLPPPPKPTALPTPLPTPQPIFNPSKSASDAFNTLTVIVQAITTLAIWVIVLVLPLVLPLVLIALVVRSIRRRGRPAPLGPRSEASGD